MTHFCQRRQMMHCRNANQTEKKKTFYDQENKCDEKQDKLPLYCPNPTYLLSSRSKVSKTEKWGCEIIQILKVKPTDGKLDARALLVAQSSITFFGQTVLDV